MKGQQYMWVIDGIIRPLFNWEFLNLNVIDGLHHSSSIWFPISSFLSTQSMKCTGMLCCLKILQNFSYQPDTYGMTMLLRLSLSLLIHLALVPSGTRRTYDRVLWRPHSDLCFTVLTMASLWTSGWCESKSRYWSVMTFSCSKFSDYGQNSIFCNIYNNNRFPPVYMVMEIIRNILTWTGDVHIMSWCKSTLFTLLTFYFR